MRGSALALACCVGLVGGCLRTSAFACSQDSECVFGGEFGVCEAVGYCSFSDETCDSDKRFGKHAGAGLGGTCVPSEGGTSTSTEDTGEESTETITPEGEETETTDESTSTSIGMETGTDTGETADPCEDYAELTEVVNAVPLAELTALVPACDAADAPLNTCLGAANDWCVEYGNGCYAGGTGLIAPDQATTTVICFSNLAERFDTTRQSLAQASGVSLSNINETQRHAQAAANGWCQANNWAHGVGPVALDLNQGTASVVCIPDEMADGQTFAAADMQAAGCPFPVAPHPVECTTALDINCRALPNGYVGGHGPTGFNASINVGLCFW